MEKPAATLASPLARPAFAWLDRVAEPLQATAGGLMRGSATGLRVKSLLNGTPFRHRLHPAIVTAPLGAWTTAVVLDALEGAVSQGNRPGMRAAADAAIAFGLLSSLPAALTGVADWVDTNGRPRRVGVAHALLNIAALGCFGTSLALRLGGARGPAKAVSGLGFGVVTLSAMLGGELVFNLGVNVPHTLFPTPPEGFTDVLAASELAEGMPRVVEAGRVPVLLLRHEGEVLAVQEWCPHLGGPLSEGVFDGDVVECPWHQSRFCLRDGTPLQGPASVPLRTFDVMERAGRIYIKPAIEG